MPRSRRAVALIALAAAAAAACGSAVPPAAGRPSAGAAAVATETITLDFGDFDAAASLTYPSARQGPFPAVLLIAGAGPVDMDGDLLDAGGAVLSHDLRDIAETLTRRGFAVMRYAKHYVLGPHSVDTLAFAKLDLKTMEADADRALHRLEDDPHVDAKRVSLYGWGEGSEIAAAVAASHPELAALVLQSPIATPWRDVFRYQIVQVAVPYLRTLAPDGRLTATELAEGQQGPGGPVARAAADYLAGPNLRLAFNAIIDPDEDGVLDIDHELLPNVDRYLDFSLSPAGSNAIYAPGRALPSVVDQSPKITAPVLVLQGATDATDPPSGAQAVDGALTASRDHTVKVYPGLGYTLGPASTAITDGDRPIAEQPLADLASWLTDHTRV